MKIRYRIFLGFALVLIIGFFLLVSWILTDVNVQPKKSMEESMVDIANILATYLETQLEGREISTIKIKNMLNRAANRKLRAQIYELQKTQTSLSIYVTDEKAIVLFDSENENNVGQDFSQWIDVRRTLRGQYGARTTRSNPDDPLSSVAYVAAPVYYHGDIIGVCSVGKSWASINSFIKTTRKKIILIAVLGVIVILVMSFLISFWITIPLQKLADYAKFVGYGVRLPLPKLGSAEVKALGEAFDQMREKMEGKSYIENYIQTLTHQLKGPLSAITGAAELLSENLPKKDQKKFVSNIQKEGERIQQIIDRLLQLAYIEKKRKLENVEKIDLKKMVEEIVESQSSVLHKKKIKILKKISKDTYMLKGERFLIRQAISNLFLNAIEFSPKGGRIEVSIQKSEKGDFLILTIADNGPGIPDYALDKIFEKFFSLHRPGEKRKSTGLGLSLVKEVTELHQGKISISNCSPHGTVAILKLPV
ncbi:MAG: two-component system sensor histidine kinase CreC [Candidatus Aminicenantes bacterium]|nr:two-component system sensor histidine kinase CreC [Candidatus Aminicenantes bacterium]